MPLALPCLALAALAVTADRPALLLPPSLGRPDRVWVSGRVLEEDHGRVGAPLRDNLRALAGSNLAGAAVEVSFLGRSARAVSGHDGEFEVAIEAAPGAPFPSGPQPVEVKAAGATARGRVLVVPADAPFVLVSDFDDTVAVTNVRSAAGLAHAALLEDGDSQPAVPGMSDLYRCLAARAPLVFVSGSPVQYAPRVERFLRRHAFPPAALLLRNLGAGTLSGYKEPALALLAERFPQPFVLVGDSGEKDPEIYGAFARERPGRALRVYIRRAGEPGPAERFLGQLLFADPAEALRDARERGLCPPPSR